MEDPPLVAEGQAPQQLEHEELDVPGRETARVILQVLGQVCVQILEHEGEAGLGVDDVVQSHNVCVAQLLQQACLSGLIIMRNMVKGIKWMKPKNYTFVNSMCINFVSLFFEK